MAVNGTVVPLAIGATLYGLCPVTLIDHGHPPHEERPADNAISRLTAAAASSSIGDSTVAPGAGGMTLTGYAPTIVIGTTQR